MRNFRNLTSIFIGAVLLAACGGGAFSPSAGSGAPMGARQHAYSAGPAASSYKVLYAFKGMPDGATPYGGLVALNGTIYGTTTQGSKNYCSGSCGGNLCYLGCGTIFTVSGAGAEKIIYNFDGLFNSGHDGSWPFSAPTALKGQFYGTTESAGASGDGTVYTTGPSGNESVIYSFKGGTDGINPEALLTAYNGTLYGTTVIGGGTACGGFGCGTVFSVTPSGTEKVLYSFQGGTDGYRVYAPVIALKGKLYGATLQGGGTGCGGNGCGTIFELSLRGKEHVLYRFNDTTDGAFPNGLIAVNGVLYGTTEGGGTKNSGTFFSVTTTGTLKTLYNFTDIPDGNLPGASLIYSKTKDKFYGTTVGGGTAGHGTVFQITKSGKESVLHSFLGGTDGENLNAPLIMLHDVLYGMTVQGGNSGCASGYGCGTIFKLRP